MAALPPESLKFIVNHVILPPRLPQKAEDSQISRAAERDLVGVLSAQVNTYLGSVDPQSSNIHAGWLSIGAMLDRCALLISTYALSADLLVRSFQSLKTTSESRDMVVGIIELISVFRRALHPSYLPQSSECGAHPAQNRGSDYL